MGFLIIFGIIICFLICIFKDFDSNSSVNSKPHSSSGPNPYQGYRSTYHTINTYHKTNYSKRNATDAPASYVTAKRKDFERMKETKFFKDWKKAQYEAQDHKCAYCKCYVDIHSPNTQVDHVKPLRHYGTNEYDNLVLACKTCNFDLKGANYSWYDKKGKYHEGWQKPDWIKENPVLKRAKDAKIKREAEKSIIDYCSIKF